MKNKVHLTQAIDIAREYIDFLTPHCEQIEIAGSIRRQKDMVGDIEILFIPEKREEQDPNDMFRTREVDLAWRAIETNWVFIPTAGSRWISLLLLATTGLIIWFVGRAGPRTM